MEEAIKEQMIKTAIHKKKLKKQFGEECVFCGCTNKLILTIDHKIPKSRGGTDEDNNKQVACFFCNQLKDSLTNEEFRTYLKSLYNLKDLCKIRLLLPNKIDIVYNQHHYPQEVKENANNN